jgi:hypothetical protein
MEALVEVFGFAFVPFFELLLVALEIGFGQRQDFLVIT